MRITQKDLEGAVRRINIITHSPLESYSKSKDGKYVAKIGNYHLSYAYGGVTLHRMNNSSGGVTDPLRVGYVSKKELYTALHSFIAGLESVELPKNRIEIGE
jgi:hypothetical protein